MVNINLPPWDKLFGLRKEKPKPMPRVKVTHDFCDTRWGHNFNSWGSDVRDGEVVYKWAVWSSPRVQEGDFVIYRTEYGRAKGLVFEAEGAYNSDPPDMAWIWYRVVARYDHEGLELPEAPQSD